MLNLFVIYSMKRSSSYFLIFILFFISTIEIFAKSINYKVENLFTIKVGNDFELRTNNQSYTRFLHDTLYYSASADMVFQQRGLSTRQPKALGQYCRIMIQYQSFDEESYPCCDENIFTKADLDSLISFAKDELAPGQRFVTEPLATVKSTSGYAYVDISYIRTGTKGNVNVHICYFFNNYSYAKILLSYRSSEEKLWKKDLLNIIQSFRWIHPSYKQSASAILPASERKEQSVQSKAPSEIENSEYKDSDLGSSSNFSLLVWVVVMMTVFAFYFAKRKSRHKKGFAEAIAVENDIARGKYVSASRRLHVLQSTASQKDSKLQTKIREVKNRLDESEHTCLTTIKNDVNSALTSIQSGDVEETQNKLKDIKAKLGDEIPSNVYKEACKEIKCVEDEYSKGIIPKQDLVHVAYESPANLQQQKDFYVEITSPKFGAIVFPYRRRRVELRGYTEESFEELLRQKLRIFNNYMVIGDCALLSSEGTHPYEPDIAIIEKKSILGIRIDIEIDEPYSGYSRTPIHYLGCGDAHRDAALSAIGWMVVRFSEKQITCEPDQCVSFILYLLSRVDRTLPTQNFVIPTIDKKWTEIEAQKMAAQGFREKLLKHQFGSKSSMPLSKWDVTQTEQEREASLQATPIIYPKKQYHNIDKSLKSFDQDSHISFEPKEHIYIYDGKLELTPVSTIVSSFFNTFDSLYWSKVKASEMGKKQIEVLEDWDTKGKESREVGAFMHAQIEALLNNGHFDTSTRYTYNGEFLKINKLVNIDTELRYFRQFMADSGVIPFRTEWHIYDLSHRIAGTIDLICRDGDSYDLYDWKRSRKATPDQTIWSYGINEMNHIPDISFYHYALQQNMYKYILEHNYGLKVGKMFIVILHPIYDNYLKYEMPDLQQEMKVIFK